MWQNVNQGLSFPSESCQTCHSSLMSIFPWTSSPTLSRHAAWLIWSVRPSISTRSFLLFLPRSSSFSIIYGPFLCLVLLLGLWLRVGWLVGRSVRGGMGDGWFARFQANWNIHVCVPVSLCESDFTCTVALLGLCVCIYSVHVGGMNCSS